MERRYLIQYHYLKNEIHRAMLLSMLPESWTQPVKNMALRDVRFPLKLWLQPKSGCIHGPLSGENKPEYTRPIKFFFAQYFLSLETLQFLICSVKDSYEWSNNYNGLIFRIEGCIIYIHRIFIKKYQYTRVRTPWWNTPLKRRREKLTT